MSSWSEQEVNELQMKGNDYARRTWLKNAPPVGQNRRPREGDNIDVFKRFVVDVYENKRYYGKDEGVANVFPTPPTHVATALPLSSGGINRVTASRVPVAPTTKRVLEAPPVSVARKPAPLPAPPVVDLLDFTSMQSTAPQLAVKSSTFEADFGEIFSTASNTTVPVGSSTGVAQIQSHLFQPNFDTVSSNNSNTQSVSSSAAHDFRLIDNQTYGLETATATPAAVKKPVMSNHSMSEKSSFISSMNMSPVGTYQGWKSNNDQNYFQNGTGNMQQMGNIQMMQQQQMTMQQQQQQQMVMQQQQQQQMVMQQQQQMNGMVMGIGTRNNVMGTGMMASNYVDNKMQMNSGSGNGNSKRSMNTTLQMNMSSMNDWSSGLNK
eukprot:CAMPEP_0170880410 /NCGR_PEP_ID=MMETSP0734-20130129/32412_1 /TAXON_ID=186038 /ORGANISM="Fragilariopsis kerguelensis, Strain L26-C5" /LENGTH=377 /DNA_ID=CAMNT_0011263915 /DNA_START=208 /DNA_END=1341 /DNA_ORIENTATION=+